MLHPARECVERSAAVRRPRIVLRLATWLLLVSLSGIASAEATPIAVDVQPPDGRIPADAVREAIARELGVPTVPLESEPFSAVLLITIEAGDQATVLYRDATGEMERTVDLPGDPGPAVEMIALLCGNLARDQASELVRRFARAAPTVEPAPIAPAPAPPPPAAPPAPVAVSRVEVQASKPLRAGRLGVDAALGMGTTFSGEPLAWLVAGVVLRGARVSLAADAIVGT